MYTTINVAFKNKPLLNRLVLRRKETEMYLCRSQICQSYTEHNNNNFMVKGHLNICGLHGHIPVSVHLRQSQSYFPLFVKLQIKHFIMS